MLDIFIWQDEWFPQQQKKAVDHMYLEVIQ